MMMIMMMMMMIMMILRPKAKKYQQSECEIKQIEKYRLQSKIKHFKKFQQIKNSIVRVMWRVGVIK